MMTKMNEVKVQIPNLLAGWHLMTRAGVPKWTHVQIKALCQGELEYEKVQKALMKMFGGDHKPNTKDLRTGGKDETFYEEEWEVYDDEKAYEMTEEYDWPEEEAYEADEDEEWPEELDEAYDQCDEAYISYLESRRRMRELALSRGFYPVVAIPPDDNGGGRSSWKGGGDGWRMVHSRAWTPELKDQDVHISNIVEKAMVNKEPLYFELYVDGGNLAMELASRPNVTVATFSLPEWDFSKKDVRKTFLELLRSERPHFVWLAPPCTKWSTMQNLAARSPEAKEKLEADRQWEEENHLEFSADVSDVCDDEDIGFGLEQPHWAASWSTKALNRMNDNLVDAICDRCRTGLVYKNEGQVMGKVKKTTRIRTGSHHLFRALDLPCQCRCEHVHMDGKSKALKSMQNYEAGFTRRAADAIMMEMEEKWRQREMVRIFVSEELEEMEVEQMEKEMKKNQVTDEEKALMKTHGKKAWQVVNKLHRQLGHPSNDKLCKALKDANFPTEVIQVAKTYECGNCSSDAQRKLAKPGSLPQASHFNELMEVDTYHVKWQDKRIRILAAIDVFSRYEINCLLQQETEEEELAALENQWFNIFGAPAKLRTDSSGAHMSQRFQQRLNDYGVKLLLVPKEAHHKMGIVERLHAVRRLQLLKLLRDRPEVDLKLAIAVSCQQRNRLRSIHGSSPSQIVFGSTPNHPTGLMDEPHDPRPDYESAIQEDHSLRHAAATAFYAANHDATLRRALLARPRAPPPEVQVGDWAYYWRSGDEKLQIQRWRGPAIVCMLEPQPNTTTTSCIWLAHGSSLVRAAAEHVRPENPREKAHRLELVPDSVAAGPLTHQLQKALHPVRGPIRFLNLGAPASSHASPTPAPPAEHPESQTFPAVPDVEMDEPNDETQAIAENTAAAEPHAAQNAAAAEPHAAQNAAAAERHAAQNAAAAKTHAAQNAAAAEPHAAQSAAAAEPQQEKEPKGHEERQGAKDRSRSPQMRDERAMAFQSYNLARQLDGMKPVSEDDPRFMAHMKALEAEDEELLAESLNEKHMSAEDRAAFDHAQDKALRVIRAKKL
eukprot:g353.t1